MAVTAQPLYALRLSREVPVGEPPLGVCCRACGALKYERTIAAVEVRAEAHVSAAHRDETVQEREDLTEDMRAQAELQFDLRYGRTGGPR